MRPEIIHAIRDYLHRRIDYRRGEIDWMHQQNPHDPIAAFLAVEIETLRAELTHLVDVETGNADA